MLFQALENKAGNFPRLGNVMLQLIRELAAPCLLLLSLACGCSQEQPQQHYAQLNATVVEGVGIPGALEIGMRLDSIPKRFPDATVEPSSRASPFWWCGEKWRKHPPWRKPRSYELSVPSVGATEHGRNPTDPIEQIHFMARKEYDWPYFSGNLAGGLSFSATSTIAFAQVIARYGEPLHTMVYSSAEAATNVQHVLQLYQKQEAILAAGESLLMTCDTGQPYRLHYPARGIFFFFQGGHVHSFRIHKKVERRVASPSPPP